MADISGDELSDSSGNLSVVSNEVTSSSEDILREDDLEIEHGSAVSPRPLSFRGPELHLKFPANSDLKINQSVKTP